MPTFHITGPDGATYEVNAPDGASEQDVLSFVQQNAQPKGSAPQPAQSPQGSGIAANVAGGANSRIAELAGFPARVVNAIGAPAAAAGSYVGQKLRELTGYQPSEPAPDGVGRLSGTPSDIEGAMGAAGFDPRKVVAVTPAEKFAHGAGSGIVDALSVAMPATAVANTARAGTLTKTLADTLAAQPATQVASTAAGEGTTDATGSPTLGLLAGLAGPLGVAGAARGVRYAGSVTGLSNPADVATRKLFEAFQRDGVSPQDAIAKLQTWQQQGAKPEMLFDLGGENVRNLAKAAATVPGPGRQAAQAALINRQAGQGSRVADDIASTISPRSDFSNVTDELMNARSQKADPLYKEAFKANQSVDSNELNKILSTPAGRSALKDAATLMQNDRTLVGAVDPEMTAALREAVELGKADPVSGGVARGLKLRTLDYVKQSLYDAAEKAKVNGKATAESRAIKGLYADLTKELDRLDVTAKAGPNSLKPEGGLYAQARAAYSGPSRSLEAMDTGLGIFKEDSDVTAKEIAKLAPGDKEFFKVGVVKALKGIAENTPDGADITRRLIGRPALREKLQAAFDSPAEFRNFMGRIQREASMYANARAVNPRAGSQTTPLTESLADLKIDPTLSAIGHFLAGNYGSAAKSAGMAVVNRAQGFRPAVSGKLVETLMNPNAEKTLSVLRGLRDTPPTSAGPELNRGLVAALLADRTRQALPALPVQRQ